MKKNLILVTLIIALTTISCQSSPMAEKVSPKNLKLDPGQIKSSTLLIVVENIQNTGVTLGYGMATMVKVQDETFLATHNHWGNMLQDMNILELRNADNKMIRPIYGSEFNSLIVYQDAGTMVLRVPDGLADALTPGNLDDPPQLKPGDTVQIAYRGQPTRDKVEILEAVIEENSVSRGKPVYTLRSLNGQPLHPGDSGGGIWHNGKLVANTWAVLNNYSVVDASGNVDPNSRIPTDTSYAAIFPDVFK